MCDVRLAYYETVNGGVIRLSFHEGLANLIGDRIQLVPKGHRLYFQEGTDGMGYKVNRQGAVCFQREAQELRKFEGEYSLMHEGKFYYIDHDQVMPLTDYSFQSKLGKPRQGTKVGKIEKCKTNSGIVKENEEMGDVKEKEVTCKVEIKKTDGNGVVEFLKDKALALLLSGRSDDATVVASVINIISEN